VRINANYVGYGRDLFNLRCRFTHYRSVKKRIFLVSVLRFVSTIVGFDANHKDISIAPPSEPSLLSLLLPDGFWISYCECCVSSVSMVS
jgi:hypothetical protein